MHQGDTFCQLHAPVPPSFVRCDACSLRILGTRVICLDCVVYSVGGTMDFCADPRCYSKIVHREDPVGCHEPTHKLLKVRTELQWYELNWMPGEKMKLPYLNLLDMDLSQRNHSIPRAQCCSICSGSTGSMALLWRCTVCTGEISSPPVTQRSTTNTRC